MGIKYFVLSLRSEYRIDVWWRHKFVGSATRSTCVLGGACRSFLFSRHGLAPRPWRRCARRLVSLARL